jgi:hypothetical protein
MSREAMQMALEALESDPISHVGLISRKQAITALRQVLKTEQEPVAWISDSPTKGNGKQLHWTKSEAWRWSSNITPLYTAPQKKEWVGLTDEECIKSLPVMPYEYEFNVQALLEYTKIVEAKLKDKNT